MRRYVLAILGMAVLTGCGVADRGETALADSTARDLSLAPADSGAAINDVPVAGATAPEAPAATTPPPEAPAPAPTRPRATRPRPANPPAAAPAPDPTPPAPPTLNEGTAFEATSTIEITSRRNKPGETFTATIAEAVKDARGREVIPAGAEVTLSIVQLAPAEDKGDKDGKLQLTPVSVRFGGNQYSITGTVDSVEHTLKGRGVTAGDAAKVGIGAAAGAVAGRILSGKGKGAVVGGVVGAAAGTAVAVETADRDVVIPVGGKIRLTLTAPFSATS